MKFRCPHCCVKIKAEEDWYGLTTECPFCGKEITVPKPDHDQNAAGMDWDQVAGSKGGEREDPRAITLKDPAAKMMRFACPKCGQHFEGDETWSARTVQCKTCGTSFSVGRRKVEASPGMSEPEGDTPPLPCAIALPPRRARVPPPPRRKPVAPNLAENSCEDSKQRQGPGIGVFALVCIMGCAAIVVYVRHETDSPPPRHWDRFLQSVEGQKPAIEEKRPPEDKTEPAHGSESAATPMLPPAATPGPAVASRPAATPAREVVVAPDPIKWLSDHKVFWPKEVVLLNKTEFPAVYEGRIAGSLYAPPGTFAELVDIREGTVGVLFNGGGARIPIAQTDLPQRARMAMASAATIAAAAAASPAEGAAAPGIPFPITGDRIPVVMENRVGKVATINREAVTLTGRAEIHITGDGDPLEGSVFNFQSPDAWLFLDTVAPSTVEAKLLDRMWVNGRPAVLDSNLRVAQYGTGSVIIPQGPDLAAMTVFSGMSLSGSSMPLQCYTKYDDASLGAMKRSISSFRLKRGYMATIAQEENGTGISKNYVAQDSDIQISSLPAGLDRNIRFIRIFPWQWVSKKGIAGGIWQNFNVGWYYDWSIDANSRPDLEYVPIRQARWWPGLDQDWRARGATHLLGYNEPDHKDQSNLKVDDAIYSWPDLLATGLRLGSPAVSDGGLSWLYDFIAKADAAHLRVDFVAVHYYRAASNAGDGSRAAAQFYDFLREIHDRTRRPIWVTEWNNGANWTGHDPTYAQEKAAVAAMIKMLDRTPFVERYAIYNWVKDVRNVQRDDGSLTPAGEVYRDDVSPLSYIQADP